MSVVALCIAAGLIFSAGFVCGCRWATRRAFANGYVRALYDCADDDAIARALEPSEAMQRILHQREVAPWQ